MTPPSSGPRSFPAGPADVPAATRRLFPHTPLTDADLAEPGSFVLARVLEDGDSRDLAWLVATVGEEGLARWLAERGGRQLSRRSRAFWRRVLTTEPATPHPLAEELWPL